MTGLHFLVPTWLCSKQKGKGKGVLHMVTFIVFCLIYLFICLFVYFFVQGWCGWKGPDFWNQQVHYNMCMPQRPDMIWWWWRYFRYFSILPGAWACNSINKPMQWHFYRRVNFRYFSRKIGQFQSTWARFGEDKTMQPNLNMAKSVDMSTLVCACVCNWSLRFPWGSEFEINSN